MFIISDSICDGAKRADSAADDDSDNFMPENAYSELEVTDKTGTF